MHSQVRNDDFLAVFPIAAPDPDWWTENVNSELFSSEVHQDSQITFESVLETSQAIEATDSVSAVFQPASQHPAFVQEQLDFNVSDNFAIAFEQTAPQTYPNSADCMVFQNSIPTVQPDWNPTNSPSTLGSDCDSYSSSSRVSTPPENETLCQESQQNRKNRISTPRSVICPHCPIKFASERRLGSHIQKSHRNPSTCNHCGKRFGLSRSLNRHLALSCQKGLSPKQRIACKCGKTYSRRDGFLRHIKDMTGKSEGDEHHAVLGWFM